MELINRHIAYFKAYPEDDFSAECLDKVHMIYSGMGAYQKSASFADSLLEKFPKYAGRSLILQSQASNYDIFLVPRDTTKVRVYYDMLLGGESLDMEVWREREAIELRLKFLHLDFDRYIDTLVMLN